MRFLYQHCAQLHSNIRGNQGHDQSATAVHKEGKVRYRAGRRRKARGIRDFTREHYDKYASARRRCCCPGEIARRLSFPDERVRKLLRFNSFPACCGSEEKERESLLKAM